MLENDAIYLSLFPTVFICMLNLCSCEFTLTNCQQQFNMNEKIVKEFYKIFDFIDPSSTIIDFVVVLMSMKFNPLVEKTWKVD